MEESLSTPRKLSKKQAIVTVLLAACCVSLPASFLRTSSVLYIAFQNNYNASATEASVLSSFLFGSYYCFGPGTTVMLNCFGFTSTICTGSILLLTGLVSSSFVNSVTLLYFTCGILPGVGIAMVHSAVYVFVGKIFDRKRPFVNNILLASTAIVMMPYILQHLIDTYGFKSSLFRASAVLLIPLPIGIILTIMPRFYPQVIRQRLSVPKNKNIFATDLLKKPAFVFYMLSGGFSVAVKLLCGMYIFSLAVSNGIETIDMAKVCVFGSVLTTGLRPLSGYLCSKKTVFGCAVNRLTILTILGVIRSLACFVLGYFSVSVSTLTAAFLFLKFTSGCIGALPMTIAADLFGKDKLSSSVGFQMFVKGVFAIVTPILTGCLLDNFTGNSAPSDLYRLPMYMACGCSATFSLLLVAVRHYITDSTCEEADKGTYETPMKPIEEEDTVGSLML